MQIRWEFFSAKLLTDKQTNKDENVTSLAEVTTTTTTTLKPWFHVQLLYAIILGSGRGYRSQCV